MKAVVPTEVPALPNGCNAWARSTKRAGGMFHAHASGFTACGKVRLDRHKSKSAEGLGDFQYFGACPHCMKFSPALRWGLSVKGEEAAKFDSREDAEKAFVEAGLDRDNIGLTLCVLTKRADVYGPLGSWYGYLARVPEIEEE